MKKAITSTIVGLIALLPVAQAQESPKPLSGAQVTIPYEELKRILDLARPTPALESPAPPVGAALKSAHFRVSAQSAQGPLQAEAEFNAVNLSGKWEWTPLLSGVQVDKIQPLEASVVNRDGVTGLLSRDKGNHVLTLSMSGSEISFSAGDATSRVLELAKAPAGHVWEVEGCAQRISDTRYSLGTNPVSISLKPLVTEVNSQWTLRSETLVGVELLKIRTTGILTLNATEGTGQSARVKLPHEASEIRAKGSDLSGWNLTHDNEGQWLNLHWKTPRLLNRSIEVFYNLPVPAAGKPLLVRTPELEKGESEALVALTTEEGIEASAKEGHQLNAGSLPPWIQALPRSSEMAAQRGSGPFEFLLRYLPRAKTADATIQQAHFEMKVVADGSLLCTANFEIIHREWTQWEFTLPENSVLLSCQRNAISADPIISGKQVLSLQLPSQSEEGDSITRVRLMYTAKTGAMDPVEGALTLKLPSTPLFIQQTDWVVHIPNTYRVRAIEGNVAIKPSKSAAEGIALTKSFNHGDQAVAQLHYRKQGLEE